MEHLTVQQSISRTLPDNAGKILVAVSGGVDSVVLLHALCAVAKSHGLTVAVAHLNHEIRPQGTSDAEFVRQMCHTLSVPCRIESRDVMQLAQHRKVSLETAGRQARREFFARFMDEEGFDVVALAHHRDDQVETFLQRLLRGSGQSGLAGMHPLGGRYWRPLLDCTRCQILSYAGYFGLNWVEDESNTDQLFLRNRLRHKIIPLLSEINPQFPDRVCTLVAQIQREEDFWQQQVEAAMGAVVVSSHDGLRLARKDLLELHPALRRRVLREALRVVRGNLHQIESVHIEAAEGLISGARSQAQIDIPAGWMARRYDILWLRRVAPRPLETYNEVLPLTGEVELPGGFSVNASLIPSPAGESADVAEFALCDLDLPLSVRTWRQGDRMEPAGMIGSKKLKRLFSDKQVEFEVRHSLPLLLSGEKILWVPGLRRSRHARATRAKGETLRLEVFRRPKKRTKNL